MKLTDAEKLILLMLSEIHERLEIESDLNPKFVRQAINTGNTWGLSWRHSDILSGDVQTPAEVVEVIDTLDMWDSIEASYAQLPPAEKDRIETEAGPFGTDIEFRGFDGNNEFEQMSIARFLVEDLGRFERFNGRELNSHTVSLESYRRMLAVFLPLRPSLGQRRKPYLTADEIIEILRSQIHPERRRPVARPTIQ